MVEPLVKVVVVFLFNELTKKPAVIMSLFFFNKTGYCRTEPVHSYQVSPSFECFSSPDKLLQGK